MVSFFNDKFLQNYWKVTWCDMGLHEFKVEKCLQFLTIVNLVKATINWGLEWGVFFLRSHRTDCYQSSNLLWFGIGLFRLTKQALKLTACRKKKFFSRLNKFCWKLKQFFIKCDYFLKNIQINKILIWKQIYKIFMIWIVLCSSLLNKFNILTIKLKK